VKGFRPRPDIILGLPEETYESFTDGLSTVLEWGQHNRSLLLNVSMVPDAEMSHRDQRVEYGLETVRTRLVNPHGRMEEEECPETQELVIATRTMPREDWVRARAFAYTTSLLHFDKLLQIPFVICRELGTLEQNGEPVRPRYKDLIGLFVAPDLDPERFPCVTGIRDFFLAHARSIQRGEDEYCYSEAWLDVYWPPDEYMFITLVREGKLEQLHEEARRLLVEGLVIDEQLVREALALNLALLELPFRTGSRVLECTWNVLEIYRGVLAAQQVDLVHGSYHHHVDWSQSQWSTWDDWFEKVVWWRNRAGQYFLRPNAVRSDPPLPAGHYY
jgi:hypothetical protein